MIRSMGTKDKSYLKGQLLLAMPQMGDPRFHRSVIYVCSHDTKGAMGLVVNHVLPGLSFKSVLEQFDITPDKKVSEDLAQRPVLMGGPVENVRGFLLHDKNFITSDTVHIDGTFSISSTLVALKAVARGEGPDHMLLALGYAGWEAQQLEHEIQENAWLTAPATEDLLFHTAPDLMWDKVMASIGINPAMLSGAAGRA
ncbi:MAG: YqgE/AlgH family protein [Rhodospirillales bacterium]|nr:YqgE/AlgH family protein [Alphaproteobacteria bacterium]USO04179.1 MAG: YqgE/AlgH family protein [Rhodospirillales bacterium]